jgi:predicted RNA polymerase sigma factor
VSEGLKHLELSARGVDLTEYHVESAIASVHVTAARTEDTNWARIVELYDTLIKIRPSPVVALNRAIAVAQHEGPRRGLEKIYAIENRDRLSTYPFYPAALGELEFRQQKHREAHEYFRTALTLARNPMECHFLRQRLSRCEEYMSNQSRLDTFCLSGCFSKPPVVVEPRRNAHEIMRRAETAR